MHRSNITIQVILELVQIRMRLWVVKPLPDRLQDSFPPHRSHAQRRLLSVNSSCSVAWTELLVLCWRPTVHRQCGHTPSRCARRWTQTTSASPANTLVCHDHNRCVSLGFVANSETSASVTPSRSALCILSPFIDVFMAFKVPNPKMLLTSDYRKT